ncbi:MAG TPA: hypothetical protein VFH53_05330, partial [Phycisphaerae bacterium]|nr:hypothetical protein [Phycisphaerae bacterium]
MRKARILLVALPLLVVVGVCAGAAHAAVDYEYFYDPQMGTFTEVYDPLSWGEPSWISGDMRVPNCARPEPWEKTVGVTVGYVGGTAPTLPPGFVLVVSEGSETPVLVSEWYLKYPLSEYELWSGRCYLPEQPASETIDFGEEGYRTGAQLANGFT